MRTLSLFLFLISATFASAQWGRVQDVNVSPDRSGAVFIRFSVSPGPPCEGFNVQHSTDSIVFRNVHESFESFGGSGTTEVKEWVHTSPAYNTTNFYRIEIRSPFEQSLIRRIYVSEPGRSRLMPYPNPLFGSMNLLSLRAFDAGSARMTGFLYNRLGYPLRELNVIFTQELGAINVGDLEDGLYVIWLTEGTTVYSCKFVVKG
jgi:hypothetical protein